MSILWYLEINGVRSRAGVLGWNSGSPLCMCGDRFYSSPSLNDLDCKMGRVRVAAALGACEIAWDVSGSKEVTDLLYLLLMPLLCCSMPEGLILSLAEDHRLCGKGAQASAFPIPSLLQCRQSFPSFTRLHCTRTPVCHLSIWGWELHIQFPCFTHSVLYNRKHVLNNCLNHQKGEKMTYLGNTGDCIKFKGYFWKHTETPWHM